MKFYSIVNIFSFIVSGPRDEMSHFVTRVSDDLQEECHSSMLHDNMNISRLMVHDRQVKKARSRTKTRDSKRERSFEGGSSKNKIAIQDKPRFKKKSSSQVPSKFPKDRDDKLAKPRAQKDKKSRNSPNEKATCAKCGKGLFPSVFGLNGQLFVLY